jgi:predicted MFS family arabinose efflux permease
LTAALGLEWVFVVTFLPGIAAVLAIAFLVREREHAPRPRGRFWEGLGSLPKGYYQYLAGVGVAGIGDYSKLLLILWATNAFGAFLDPAYHDPASRDPHKAELASLLAMAYYVGYNLVYMLSCYVSGVLADRLPKKWVLSGGYALAVVPATGLLLPLNPFVGFAIAFGFAGLYMGVWETVESTTAATLLPKDIRGAGFGLLDTVNGLGDFISSAVVGLLWVTVSPVAAMSFVIATSLLGAAVIAGLPAI